MSNIFYILIGLVIYFLPTLIAYHRKHPYREGVLALNFLLGWSVIGWIAAFVWAVATRRD